LRLAQSASGHDPADRLQTVTKPTLSYFLRKK